MGVRPTLFVSKFVLYSVCYIHVFIRNLPPLPRIWHCLRYGPRGPQAWSQMTRISPSGLSCLVSTLSTAQTIRWRLAQSRGSGPLSPRSPLIILLAPNSTVAANYHLSLLPPSVMPAGSRDFHSPLGGGCGLVDLWFQ